MQVGDRVVFVGSEYEYASGPTIGERGTVTAREGHTYTDNTGAGELVTVRFDLDSKDTVLCISRLKVEASKESTNA